MAKVKIGCTVEVVSCFLRSIHERAVNPAKVKERGELNFVPV